MKRRVPSVVVGIFALALSAQAQTSFWWTNSVDDAWSNPLAWTNSAPTAPGSNDFVLTFQNTAAVTSSNDLGAFTLNQLVAAGADLTLSGSNLVFQTSTGAVAPQFLQNSSGLITINNALILSNTLTFAGTSTGTVTATGVLSGPGGLTLNGPYTLSLMASNNYTGNTTINTGTVQVAGMLYSNAATVSAVLTVTTGAVLEVKTFGLALTQSLGNLYNSCTNLILNGGTVRLAANGSAGRAYTIGAGGGTLEVASGVTWTNSFNASLTNAYTTGTFTLAGAGTGQMDKIIGGAGALVKEGAGLWTISSNNTYAGPTFINNGTLRAGALKAFGANTAITVASGATLDINGQLLTNYTVTVSGAGVGGTGAIINNGANQINALSNIVLTADAVVGGTGRFDLRTAAGTPTLNLNSNTLVKVGGNILGVVKGWVTDGSIIVSNGTLALHDTTTCTNNYGSITITANGTLDFWGNTAGKITRPITLAGGTISTTSNSATNDSPITLTAASFITATSNLTLNGIITGPGNFTKLGGATLILTNANTFAGGILLAAGTLNINADAALGAIPGSPTTNLAFTGNGTLVANTTLAATRTILLTNGVTATFNNSSTLTINGEITGAGKLNKLGAGTLVLNGTNTFTGNVVHTNNGFIVVANSAALGTNAAAKTVTITGNSQTLILNGAAGDINLDNTINFITSYNSGNGAISNAAGNNAINGLIQMTGGAGYTKIGVNTGSTLTLAGTITNIVAATLRNLMIYGGGNTYITGRIVDGAGASLTGLEKYDAGLLTLSATNTYSNPTLINGGILALSPTGSISNSATINVGASSTFDVTAVPGYTLFANQTLTGNGTITGNVTTAGAAQIQPAGTLTFRNDLTLTPNATNLAFDLTLTPAGTNDLITQLGQLTPNSNVIAITPLAGVLTTGAYTLITYGTKSGSFVATPAGLNTTRLTWAIDESTTNQINLLVAGASANLTWFPTVNGDWDLGTTNWFAAAPDRYFDLDNVTFDDTGAGTNLVNLTTTLRPGSITVNSASNYTFTGAGKLSGTTALLKDGPGLLTIATANDFTGGTVITNGAILVATNAALGTASVTVLSELQYSNTIILANALNLAGTLRNVAGSNTQSGAVTITNNVSLIADAGTLTLTGPITGTGSLAKDGVATIVITGTNSYTGGTTINTGTLTVAGATPSLGTGLVIVNTNGLLELNTGSAAQQFNHFTNNITGTGLILKSGGNDVRLIGSNTFSGLVRITGGASSVFVFGSTNAALGLPGVDVQAGRLAMSEIFNNTPLTLSYLTGNSGTIDPNYNYPGGVTAGYRILSVNQSTNTVFGSTIISGSSGRDITLVKSGPGTLTLTATNTYTGATTINGGVLALGPTGSISNSATINVGVSGTFDVTARAGYTLYANQLLAGTGTITGDVATAVGARIAGGNNNATDAPIFANNLGLATGATNFFDFAASGTTNDYINVTGNLTGNNSYVSIILLNPNSPMPDATYRLYNYAGTLPTGFNITALGNTTRAIWTVDTSVLNQVNLNVAGTVTSNLVWQPTTASSNLWNLANTSWTNTATGAADKFYDLDTVTFDDTGAAYSNGVVNLTATVRPSAVIVSSGSNYTFNGTGKITGTTGLTKDGTGTLTISTANDYTGATILSNGVLKAGNASAFGSNIAPLTVVAGALDLNALNLSKYNVTLAGGMITNSAGQQTQAFSNLTVTANSTIGGFGRWDVRGISGNPTSAFTVINSGVILTKTDTNEIYLTVYGTVTNNGQVVVNQGYAALYSTMPAGTGSFTVNAAGTLALELATNSLPVFLNGGTLSTTSPGGNGVAGQTATITLLTNSTINAANAFTISGNISESGGPSGFTKLGAGILSLTGTNTYTGPTTVSAGTLRVGDNTPTGTLGAGDVTNAATVVFYRTNAHTVSNNFILAAGATLNQSGTGPVLLTGNISSVGDTNGTIVQAANSGTLTLAGTNSFAALNLDGLTTAQPTILAAGSSNTITTINVGNGTAYGRLHIEPGAAVRVAGSFYLGQNVSRTGEVVNAGNISVGGQVRVGHYSTETSTFTMNGGSLIITGTGTNPFGGGEQNGALYLGIDGTGVFIQNGGTVQAQGLVLDNRSDTAGTDTYTLAGGSLILSNWGIQGNASTLFNAGGGTISATANWTGSRPMNLTNLNGLTTFDTAGYTITLSGILSGTGGLTNTGTGTLILTANETYTGGTFLNAGTLQLGNATTTGSIPDTNLTINTGATLAFAHSNDLTNWLTLAGGGALVQKGAGNLIITNLNTYTGDTILNAGTLTADILANSGLASHVGAGTNLVFGGGALRYTGSTTGIDRPVLLNAAGGFDVTNAATALTLTGLLTGTGSLTKYGAGALVLTASNLYTGVTVLNGGTLQLSGGDNRLPVTTVTFTGNARLDLGGNSQTLSNLTLTGVPRTGTITNGQLIITGTSDLIVGATNNNSYQQLNLTGLAGFTYNAPAAVLRVAYNAAGTGLATGELFLASSGTNLITATAINVGEAYTANGGLNNIGFLHLGTTNILNVNRLFAAWARSYGTIDVPAGLSNVFVRIRGTGGTDTDYTVITNGYTSAGSGGWTRGDILLTNATLDARVSSLVLGYHFSGNASGATNSFLMGPGTLIATNILIAQDTGTGNGVLGTFGLYGGTVQALTITLGERSGGTVNSVFNFNSGTINAQTIQAGAGTAGRTFNWTSGTIANYDAATDLLITNLTLTLTAGANHVFAIDTGRTGTVAAVLASGGTLVKNGDGALILSGSNTFTGPTAINAGQLLINNRWAAQNSTVSNLIPGGVIFTTVTNAFLFGGLAGTGDIVLTNAGGPVALAIGNNNANATYTGILSEAGSVTKVGSGLQILTGTNTYTGNTTIAGGILRADPGVGIPTNGNLTINGGVWETASGLATNWGAGSGQFQVPGGTSGFSAYNNPLTVNLGGTGATVVWGTNILNPATLVLNETTANTNLVFVNGIDFGGSARTIAVNANIATLTGVLTNGGLTKTGAGTLAISNANVYTGGTTLSAGTLKLINTAALGAAGAAVALNGGTLQLATDAAVNSANVTMGGSAAIVLDRATGGAGFNTTFGNFKATAGSYTLTVTNGPNITGNATLTFSGTWSNSGQTTTFNIGSGSVVNLSGNTPANAQTISVVKNGGGRLILSGGYGTWDAGNAIALNAGTLDMRSIPGDTGVFRNITAASNTVLALTQNSGINFYSGLTVNGPMTTTVDRVTLGTGVTHTLGTLAIGNSTLTVTAGANITNGNAGLTFTGATTLSGSPTFNIVNPITGGGTSTLTVAAINNGANTVTLTGNGNFAATGAIGSGVGGLILDALYSGTATLTGTNTYTGDTIVNGGTLTLTGPAAGGGTSKLASATIYVNPAGTLYLGAFSQLNYGPGTPAVILNGGTLAMSDNQYNYVKNITLTNGATWALGTGNLINGLTGANFNLTSVTSQASSATNLITSRGGAIALNGAAGDGTVTFNVDRGTAATDLLVSAPLTDYNSHTGSLVKAGAGILTLTATNTYSGITAINAGTLALAATALMTNTVAFNIASNASLDVTAGGLTLQAGQSLQGNGTVLGALTVGTGATISPGNSIGLLTFSNSLTLAGTTYLELDKGNNTNDVINVVGVGVLTFGGDLIVTNLTGTLAMNDMFTLFTGTFSNGTAFNTVQLPALDPELSWSTEHLYNLGQIVVIPEPGAFTLVVLGLLGSLLLRKRRQT